MLPVRKPRTLARSAGPQPRRRSRAIGSSAGRCVSAATARSPRAERPSGRRRRRAAARSRARRGGPPRDVAQPRARRAAARAASRSPRGARATTASVLAEVDAPAASCAAETRSASSASRSRPRSRSPRARRGRRSPTATPTGIAPSGERPLERRLLLGREPLAGSAPRARRSHGSSGSLATSGSWRRRRCRCRGPAPAQVEPAVEGAPRRARARGSTGAPARRHPSLDALDRDPAGRRGGKPRRLDDGGVAGVDGPSGGDAAVGILGEQQPSERRVAAVPEPAHQTTAWCLARVRAT